MTTSTDFKCLCPTKARNSSSQQIQSEKKIHVKPGINFFSQDGQPKTHRESGHGRTSLPSTSTKANHSPQLVQYSQRPNFECPSTELCRNPNKRELCFQTNIWLKNLNGICVWFGCTWSIAIKWLQPNCFADIHCTFNTGLSPVTSRGRLVQW